MYQCDFCCNFKHFGCILIISASQLSERKINDFLEVSEIEIILEFS